MMKWVLLVQVVTYIVLGVFFITRGDWRLGSCQLLLAAVQTIIYSPGLTK